MIFHLVCGRTAAPAAAKPIAFASIQFFVERFRREGIENLAVVLSEDAPGHLTGEFSFSARRSLIRGGRAAPGAKRAGADSCVYLPDSVLSPVIRAFGDSGKMMMAPCAREDEGIAIAVGLDLGGRSPVCMIVHDGGFRPRLQRADPGPRPGAAHAGGDPRQPHRGGSEPYDYHGATPVQGACSRGSASPARPPARATTWRR